MFYATLMKLEKLFGIRHCASWNWIGKLKQYGCVKWFVEFADTYLEKKELDEIDNTLDKANLFPAVYANHSFDDLLFFYLPIFPSNIFTLILFSLKLLVNLFFNSNSLTKINKNKRINRRLGKPPNERGNFVPYKYATEMSMQVDEGTQDLFESITPLLAFNSLHQHIP